MDVRAGRRRRRAQAGVTGLDKEELAEPIGNLLNHNLIQALMTSATLALLDGWG